jgi:plasmid replication initiation protein
MQDNPDKIPFQKQGEVVKNNSFIRCGGLTTIQRKSFTIMLKETLDTIKEQGEKKDFYTMPLIEYRRLMKHPDNMPTKYLIKEIEELMTKIIKWDIDDEGNGTRSVMLSSFSIKKGTGILKWEFSNALTNKLLDDGYTPLKLSIVLDFGSQYALALYENLQMRKSFKKIEFELQEFRALMGVDAHEHKQMTNLKNKVLYPAIDEINAKSDMKLDYEDIKQGAKITGFKFSWDNLTSDQVRTRNQKREKIEEYQKALAPNFGNKFKIGGKWYTLTKDGFVSRGKILGGFDIVDSFEQYQVLDKQGLVSEKKGNAQPTFKFD